MAQSGSSNKKVANSLVAASAAAVLAVYAAGYAKTRSAADQFDAQSAERRPAAQEGRGPAPSNVAPASATPTIGAEVISSPAASTTTARESVPVQTASLDHAPAMASAPSSTPAPAATAQQSAEPATIASVAPAPAPVASASAPSVPEPAPAVAPAPKWKDGTYTGWGTCRHGDIQAAVIIEGGRIKEATITQCLTRYSCDVIGRLPPEVAQRQSGEVDYVSGATQSTNAFYYAVAEALGKAKLP